MVSFSEAIKTCATTKYATCKGRATRAEYWWWILFYYLVMIGDILLGIAIVNSTHEEGLAIIFLIPILYFIIPNFCVLVRRLHDIGYSGWAILFSLIPYVGGLIVFVLTLLDSEPDNKYGPNPKNIYNSNTYVYGPNSNAQFYTNNNNQYNNPQNQWENPQ